MPRCRIGHITITASNLVIGVEFVRRSLGVSPQVGGEHPRMGTRMTVLRDGSLPFSGIAPALRPQSTYEVLV
jgi:hypothetical protein